MINMTLTRAVSSISREPLTRVDVSVRRTIHVLNDSRAGDSGRVIFTPAANSPYTFSRVPPRAAFREACDESSELQQVGDPEESPLLAHDDLGISRHGVCPLRQNRAHGGDIDLQQEPLAVPVVPLAHADELPSAERMEWMRYGEEPFGRGRSVCIPDRVTSDSSAAASRACGARPRRASCASR